MKKHPVVMLHGMWGPGTFRGQSQWHNWQTYLENEGYKVIILRLPGHGDGRSADNMSIRYYVDCVKEEIRKIGKCILMGHSMGGLIAQVVANEMPWNVELPIIIEGAPPAGVRVLVPAVLKCILLYPSNLKAMISGKGFSLNAGSQRSLMMNCTPCTDEELAQLFPNKESGRAAREVSLGQIKVKPLAQRFVVVAGRNDIITPYDKQLEMFKLLKGKSGNGQLISHDGDHMPMINEHVWKPLIQQIECLITPD